MEHEGKSDWDWVCKVQGGETDAFEVLVHRHEKTIFNLLYRWLSDYNEASDVAQEVFISAYRAIKSFRGESSFSTWLYRIAINQAKNRRKSLLMAQQRTVSCALDGTPNLPHPGPDPARQAEQQEIHEQVQQGLNSLKPDDATIILLHDLQDVAYEEIAQILDIPLGTVKSRLHRARQALKARLAPYYHSLKAPK